MTHRLPDGSSFIDRLEVSRNGLSCIHRRFASNAAQYPQQIAMRDGSTSHRVCTLSNGTIDIIGRVDRQIKLRGYRIELDEIEAALRADERVESSVVLVEGDAHLQRISAFIVPRAGKNFTLAVSIKASLAERLPEYMMPASLLCVDRLALDANGKIDRRSLLHMQVQKSATPTKPANILQMQLVDIWQQILEKTAIGIHDDFFELGGHSLLTAGRWSARLHGRRRTHAIPNIKVIKVIKERFGHIDAALILKRYAHLMPAAMPRQPTKAPTSSPTSSPPAPRVRASVRGSPVAFAKKSTGMPRPRQTEIPPLSEARPKKMHKPQ